MQNHNEYLKKVEEYLKDVSVMERAKILSEINDEIINLSIPELKDPLIYANEKRIANSLYPYKEKKQFSLIALFLKLSAFMFVFITLVIGVTIWNFSPFFKVDEENNRVIILGGLIDIDGKSGKMKVFDDFHYSKESMTNDLQVNMAIPQEKDEIIINFESGAFELTTSKDDELKLDCKLATPPTDDIISNDMDLIKLDFTKINGASCGIQVPVEKKVTLEGNEGSIHINNPEFNIYIILENGKVAIKPESEIDYNYQLEVSNGMVGQFESIESDTAYEIKVDINNGSIIRK